MSQSSSSSPQDAPRRTERVHPIGRAKAVGDRLSGLAVGHRAAARSGLDGRSEIATLRPVGWTRGRTPSAPEARAAQRSAAANPRVSNHGGYTPTPTVSLVLS